MGLGHHWFFFFFKALLVFLVYNKGWEQLLYLLLFSPKPSTSSYLHFLYRLPISSTSSFSYSSLHSYRRIPVLSGWLPFPFFVLGCWKKIHKCGFSTDLPLESHSLPSQVGPRGCWGIFLLILASSVSNFPPHLFQNYTILKPLTLPPSSSLSDNVISWFSEKIRHSAGILLPSPPLPLRLTVLHSPYLFIAPWRRYPPNLLLML